MPLLYDARSSSRRQQYGGGPGLGPLGSRFSPAGGPAGAPPVSAPQAVDKPATHRCPRCRKDFLSTINQRRCIASHLGGKQGGSSGGGAGGDPSVLAAFWDSLEEGEQCEVLNVRAEQWGEHIAGQVEAAMLHRERPGLLQAMTDEQRRMHQAGKLLHQAVQAAHAARSGSAANGGPSGHLTGKQLVR